MTNNAIEHLLDAAKNAFNADAIEYLHLLPSGKYLRYVSRDCKPHISQKIDLEQKVNCHFSIRQYQGKFLVSFFKQGDGLSRRGVISILIGSQEQIDHIKENLTVLESYINLFYFFLNQYQEFKKSQLDILSGQQKLILGYLQDGYTVCDIASFLDCSKNTIKSHIERIKSKLGISFLVDVVSCSTSQK